MKVAETHFPVFLWCRFLKIRGMRLKELRLVGRGDGVLSVSLRLQGRIELLQFTQTLRRCGHWCGYRGGHGKLRTFTLLHCSCADDFLETKLERPQSIRIRFVVSSPIGPIRTLQRPRSHQRPRIRKQPKDSKQYWMHLLRPQQQTPGHSSFDRIGAHHQSPDQHQNQMYQFGRLVDPRRTQFANQLQLLLVPQPPDAEDHRCSSSVD